MDAVAPAAPSTGFQRFAANYLTDPRDLPFVRLIIECTITVALGLSLYALPSPAVFYATPVYWLIWAFWTLDRFILMLHCTSHRILFNKRASWANHIIPWMLGPFFGETPNTYFAHHLGMHHPENNLHDDLSTTLPYRRDKLSHWLIYWGKFMLFGLPSLVIYHRKRGNHRFVRKVIVGEGVYWAVIAGLLYVNWIATLAVFVIPVIAVRTLMMAGNWGQHAFVCPENPEDAFRNSITCINSRYNRRCFNDGYHIYHHVKARAHWSEMPEEFQKNIDEYASRDAIVFEGIDFFMVWLYLMFGFEKRLAKAFVHLPGTPERNEQEIIEFLRSRLDPIPNASELIASQTSAA